MRRESNKHLLGTMGGGGRPPSALVLWFRGIGSTLATFGVIALLLVGHYLPGAIVLATAFGLGLGWLIGAASLGILIWRQERRRNRIIQNPGPGPGPNPNNKAP